MAELEGAPFHTSAHRDAAQVAIRIEQLGALQFGLADLIPILLAEGLARGGLDGANH